MTKRKNVCNATRRGRKVCSGWSEKNETRSEGVHFCKLEIRIVHEGYISVSKSASVGARACLWCISIFRVREMEFREMSTVCVRVGDGHDESKMCWAESVTALIVVMTEKRSVSLGGE